MIVDKLRQYKSLTPSLPCRIRFRWWLMIGVAASGLLLLPIPSATAEEVQYRESTGEKTSVFVWTLEKNEHFDVTVHREKTRFVNRCEADGDTLKWKYRTESADIQAERHGDVIAVRGTFQGDFLQERYPVDAAPWYQPLSYSLRPFLRSEQKQVRFWTIRLDKLAPVKLKAAKKGTEHIDTPAGRFEADRIEVRLDGMLSFAWHGTYWYRKSDGLFLKYTGVNGLPGTPRTVIEVLEIRS